MHVGIATLHRERDDSTPPAAPRHERRSRRGTWACRRTPGAGALPWRAIRDAKGDLQRALDLLGRAERLYVGDFSPNVRPIAAMMARTRSRRASWERRATGRRSGDLSIDDELTYLREFEHITLARLLLARYRHGRDDRSIEDAERLLAASCGRPMMAAGSAAPSRILMLQALCTRRKAITTRDRAAGARAPSLAEPEGYVRTFIDEGAPMARLLTEARARGAMPDYAGRLLAALDAGTAAAVPPPNAAQALAGLLT